MVKFAGGLAKYPTRALCTWYIGLIVVGGLLLWMPVSRVPEAPPISLIDAMFTATSASCVTGLAVRLTGQEYSFFGQVVIVLLIQFGGIGIMTITTLVALAFGRESLRHHLVLSETLGPQHDRDPRRMIRNVIVLTLGIELVGAVLLAASAAPRMPLLEATWFGVFHAVSAFCNAGFGLPADNLMAFRDHAVVNFTVAGLVILGGIGFPVMIDAYYHASSMPPSLRWQRLMLHTKLAFAGTGLLIVFGMVMFLVFEWNNVLLGRPLAETALTAFFQSVTPRTAGFNTVDYNQLSAATLFFTVLLMGIGACPCSTGGGFKATSFMVLLLMGIARLRGRKQVVAFRRHIAPDTQSQAGVAAALFGIVAVLGLALMLAAEHRRADGVTDRSLFLDLLFETVSALGTVGLSTGITPRLRDASKLVLIVLMFIGRIGPAGVAMALSSEPRPDVLEYPKETVIVG